jgi:cysteinyl-tRNA synthetase
VRKKGERPAIAPVIGAAHAAAREVSDVLGIGRSPFAVYSRRTRAQRLGKLGLTEDDVEAKVQARIAARTAKDFAAADAIRSELEAKGVELFDSATGTQWRVRP